MSASGKKLVLISYMFPPRGGSGVQRALKAAKYLSSAGWEVDVITCRHQGLPWDDSLSGQVPSSVKVHRVFSPDPESLRTLGASWKKVPLLGAMWGFILRVYSSLCYRLSLVDIFEGWLPFAFFRTLPILLIGKTDVVYVLGMPQSGFILSYLLKKAAAIPVVIDYDDSWTTSPDAFRGAGFRNKLARKLEEAVLRNADIVVSSKESTIREITDAFPKIEKSKFRYISNGYDPDDFPGKPSGKSGKFRITYTGRISEKFFYSPESFLRALGQLIREGRVSKDDVEARFAGTVSANYEPGLRALIEEEGLGDVVSFPGFLNHKETIYLMAGSSVLLLMIESVYGKETSYKYAGWIPAKIYEYINAGVPILAIVPPGFEAELIARTRTGIVAEPNDVESVKRSLSGLYEQYKHGSLKIEPDIAVLKQYDRRELINRLADVFEEAISVSQHGSNKK